MGSAVSSRACTTAAELQRITALELGLPLADCPRMLPREGWQGPFHIVQSILQRGASTPFRGTLDIPGVEVQSVGTDHLGRDSPLRSPLKCATTQTCSWGRTVVGDLKRLAAVQMGCSPADCRLVLAREGRELNDRRRLEDYGIFDAECIQIQLRQRLRGGGHDLTQAQYNIYAADFATLDLNASGVLEMAEIHRLLEKQYERPPTDEEVADFVASADTNRDGVISLVEYVATVLKDRTFTVEGGCRISDTASRAITIEQLARVLQHLQSRLDRGEELSYIMYNGETRTIENVEQANLYDINDLVILPATEGPVCSLVEIMASGPADPDYFVSHW